ALACPGWRLRAGAGGSHPRREHSALRTGTDHPRRTEHRLSADRSARLAAADRGAARVPCLADRDRARRGRTQVPDPEAACDRGAERRNCQIETPDAIAAVRGTTWAVEVTPAQTNTFVVTGAVAVTRVTRSNTVVLADGEGVDVAPGTGPLKVTRWGEPRVRA